MTGKEGNIPKSPANRKKVEEEIECRLFVLKEKDLFSYIKQDFAIAHFVVDHPKLARRRYDEDYAAFYAINCWSDVAERVASEKGLYYILELSNNGQTGRDLIESQGIEIETKSLTKKTEVAKSRILDAEMSAAEIGKIILSLRDGTRKKQHEYLSEERLVEQLELTPISELVKAIKKFENIANLVVKYPELASRWSEKKKQYAAHISVGAWASSGRIVVDEGDEVVLSLVNNKDVTVLELALRRRKLAKEVATDEQFEDILTFNLGDRLVVDALYEQHGLRVEHDPPPLKLKEVDSKIGDLLKRELRVKKNAEKLEKVRTVK